MRETDIFALGAMSSEASESVIDRDDAGYIGFYLELYFKQGDFAAVKGETITQDFLPPVSGGMVQVSN